ncbi:DUF6961 family protein [Sphingopyxis sp.]|uniref:DUF6961 family protein n=1 Tax=Sphingopyxis sp. TaxID=1908224 RepID=UPI0039C9A0FB
MDAAREAWIRAFDVERAHGDDAEAFVARLIEAARADGDDSGFAMWASVAETLRELHLIAKEPSVPYRAQIGAPIDRAVP